MGATEFKCLKGICSQTFLDCALATKFTLCKEKLSGEKQL